MAEDTTVAQTDSAPLVSEKEPQFGHYELMVLVAGSYSDDEAAAVFADIKKIVTDHGGEVTLEDPIGRKELGYKVQGLKHGSYYAIEFDIDKSQTADLQQKVRIQKQIDRFLMISKRKKSAEELEEEKKRKEKRMIHRQVRKQKEAEEAAKEREAEKAEKAAKAEKTETKEAATTPAKEQPATEAPATAEAAEAPTKAEKPAEKPEGSLEEIDKKIDTILSDDISL